jgi:cell division protein FtsL
MSSQAKPAARRGAKIRSQAPDSTGNRKRRPPRQTLTGLWIALMLLFFAEALVYAWCRVQCVNAGYGIDHETRRHRALVAARNNLKIELARLKAPERIETIARTRLGLTMPDAQQTVILR